ncbi:hypothetical protein niasHT_028232 [Heterodera trifolii]|uniref:Uncharacterized protein n=1 Tax=Heterodera trifolii TaxID=157864 RepID=A0ABD2K8P1_9BILA
MPPFGLLFRDFPIAFTLPRLFRFFHPFLRLVPAAVCPPPLLLFPTGFSSVLPPPPSSFVVQDDILLEHCLSLPNWQGLLHDGSIHYWKQRFAIVDANNISVDGSPKRIQKEEKQLALLLLYSSHNFGKLKLFKCDD